ncbi:NAD(P)-binding domain protein [Akanthomyces lecanii RCEF 1005]|uniref:NAD(P)-binding domain protein n=1 Tax=Akanthomyces lecanii RCEF 1005 TaxID=1081108 RepID=A0A162N649_CORDF|nr:NAD(P)-binding domain protein [Akanthomyces lecanii RCEF 1005]
MANLLVAVAGATGETGSSIIDSLVESGKFTIIALTRQESLSKPANVKLRERGVDTVVVDLDGDKGLLAAALAGVNVVISAMSPFDAHLQYALADAAKREELYNYIKSIDLPYTIIDVGWWYQASVPRLPSGKLDYITKFNRSDIAGDGNTPSAITDKRDVGQYVVRIIQDSRTINKYVFAYSELWTPNEIYALFEEMSGEKTAREYVSEQELQERVRDASVALDVDPSDARALWTKANGEIQHSLEIRGDNTPETAKALGYLIGKELYPDIEFRSFRSLAQEVLDGQGVPLYESNDRFKKF